MNGFVLNGSKSSVCSPVPINMIGLFVAATLLINYHIDILLIVDFKFKKKRKLTQTGHHHPWHVNLIW